MGIATLALFAILLTWQDNADNENGSLIQKTISGDCINGFETIGYVGINVITFTDDLGSAGDCYRVAAFNSDGVSGYSNTAQIPAAPEPPPKKCKGKKC